MMMNTNGYSADAIFAAQAAGNSTNADDRQFWLEKRNEYEFRARLAQRAQLARNRELA